MFVFQEQRYLNLCKQRITTILHFGLQSAGFIKKENYLYAKVHQSVGIGRASEGRDKSTGTLHLITDVCPSCNPEGFGLQSRRLRTAIQKALDSNLDIEKLEYPPISIAVLTKKY